MMRVIGFALIFACAALMCCTYLLLDDNQKCHMRGPLPDPVCTTGLVDSRVTQANIHETICVPGYSKKVRPPVYYTGPLKRQLMQDYGISGKNPANYELDHLIPIELGGHPWDPKNLWPQPRLEYPGAEEKDLVENAAHKAVCRNKMSLSEAQIEVATDWVALGTKLKKFVNWVHFIE